MILTDLFSIAELNTEIDAGFVSVRTHPELPYLSILNYTDKCAYSRRWNRVTEACRGLIVKDGHLVISRPFKKFFNYGEPDCPRLIEIDAVEVTEKLDGSLGILYPHPEQPTGYAIATRGSFTSDQAIYGTEILQKYVGNFWPVGGTTYLFEIIYPENRVVVDYGTDEEIVLIGAVHTKTGTAISVAGIYEWPGPKTTIYPYKTFAEVLLHEPEENAEGIVVYAYHQGVRVKIKYDEYIRLHRLVTGLTARKVWEQVSEGVLLSDILSTLPEEFHDWVREVYDTLQDEVNSEWCRLVNLYAAIPKEIKEDRKAFAEYVIHDSRCVKSAWAFFNLLDGKQIIPKLWRNAKPSGNWVPREFVK